MKKLLVIRNDKLGDLILTLPALKMIKSSVKDIQIDCLLDEKYFRHMVHYKGDPATNIYNRFANRYREVGREVGQIIRIHANR